MSVGEGHVPRKQEEGEGVGVCKLKVQLEAEVGVRKLGLMTACHAVGDWRGEGVKSGMCHVHRHICM